MGFRQWHIGTGHLHTFWGIFLTSRRCDIRNILKAKQVIFPRTTRIAKASEYRHISAKEFTKTGWYR